MKPNKFFTALRAAAMALTLLSFITLSARAQTVTYDGMTFDKEFLEALATINGTLFTNPSDISTIQKNRVEALVDLSVAPSVTLITPLSSLQGIEYFVNLEIFYCHGNNLSGELDLSALTKLTDLDCENCGISSLKLAAGVPLIKLLCNGNQLTSLDLSGKTTLKWLNVSDNPLTTLDASGLTNLEELFCFTSNGNPSGSLVSLDASGCTSLLILDCFNNSITSLDVAGCTSLVELYCNYNQLSSLDVSGLSSLETLYCNNNQLTSLTLTGLSVSDFHYLRINDNDLLSVDVTGLNGLYALWAANNYFSSVNDIIGFQSLTYYSWITTTASNYSFDPQKTPLSSAKDITAFAIPGQTGSTTIGANDISLTMPYGTDVTNLTPAITVSAAASVSPVSGAAQDFTTPATYTVTAEDNSTKTYTVTVTVAPPPTYAVAFAVTGGNGTLTATVDGASITSGDPVVEGKNVVFTAIPAAGYRVSSWTDNAATVNGTNTTYTITALAAAHAVTIAFEAIPPAITGPTAMTLTVGYAATSSGVFTTAGAPPVTVTKTSGDSRITWNSTTMRLDIAAGLPDGSYPVVLTASNGVTPDAQLTFTLTVVTPVYYSISISPTSGGTVSTDKMSAYPGEIVTLTITPNAGYSLTTINVQYNNGRDAVATQGTGVTRTFTMPSADVTVTAAFENLTYQAAWEAAKAIIEAADFSVLQKEANTQTELRYRLAEIINELIKSTGFFISPYDIVIFDYNFHQAKAGDAVNRSGTNGYFEFRVTPPDTRTSAYNDGTITATSYNDVANEQLTMNNEQLKVWAKNGVLHVSGLTAGEPWAVFNLSGQPLCTGVSNGEKAEILLPGRGIYIFKSGNFAVKVAQ